MLDRLTAQDLLMLGADDFGWSEDIGVLAILDGTRLLDGDGRVRIDEVRRRLEAAAPGPALPAAAVPAPAGLGWPLWVDAPADLADHVRVHPGGRARRPGPAAGGVRGCTGDAWTCPGRCGRPGSPGLPGRDRWACSSAPTTPSPTAWPAWPPSARCWTWPPTRPRRSRHPGRRPRCRPRERSSATTCAAPTATRSRAVGPPHPSRRRRGALVWRELFTERARAASTARSARPPAGHRPRSP